MSDINPIHAAVAERLYEFVRIRELASNFKSTVGPSPWIALSDDLRVAWIRQAEQLIEPMLAAAAEAYSRSNTIVDPDVLDVVTGEDAEKIGARFREWRMAWRSSNDGHIKFPNHAVSAGLAAGAALRAAFGWTPSLTAPEIVDSMRDGEQQTPAGDAVRLHLASAHGHPIGLGAGDGEAGALHEQMHHHASVRYPHDLSDLRWSEEEIREEIEKLAGRGYPKEQFLRPLQQHLDRMPHTVDCDHLRLHLMSAHRLINAATLRDHEVIDAHEHEHNGPGTIRNHPRESTAWTSLRVHETLGDVLLDEPDDPLGYAAATHKVMSRLLRETS